MRTDELHLVLLRTKKRIWGQVSIGISRLGVTMFISRFIRGYTIKQVMKEYPQLEYSDLVVIRQLAMEIKQLMKEFNG